MPEGKTHLGAGTVPVEYSECITEMARGGVEKHARGGALPTRSAGKKFKSEANEAEPGCMGAYKGQRAGDPYGFQQPDDAFQGWVPASPKFYPDSIDYQCCDDMPIPENATHPPHRYFEENFVPGGAYAPLQGIRDAPIFHEDARSENIQARLYFREYLRVNRHMQPRDIILEAISKTQLIFESMYCYLHSVSGCIGAGDVLQEHLNNLRPKIDILREVALDMGGIGRAIDVDDVLFYKDCELRYRRGFEDRENSSFYKNKYHAFFDASEDLVAVKNLVKIGSSDDGNEEYKTERKGCSK